ncbi:NAD-dependent epimerase/dehydratase family protein [Caenimonas aquaedulcis]|uniref:NAD(P)-dependent oxidoreductase n=1 Tax=Caenimonas aquaedulcis TaxID=2793270 RepID=A0A931H1D8_9BURK|nr:NAD(P)-dependent oxidoreductase [Caenimonas aquaedulcis]MBG9386766.1 NAD(P)-dependent oxidoreductase [Caenimonas aquaedulcis]
MRVLITGGTGFVGLNLAQALLGHGHQVDFFDLREPPAPFMQAIGDARARVRVETGDVCNASHIERVFGAGGITHVFHGAAITPGPARESLAPQQIIDVNLSATLAIVRAAAQAGVQRLLFPSSLTVYGEHLYGTAPLDEETTPPVPDSLYAITKYAAERAALKLGKAWGLDVIAGRIGAVFGPWEGNTQVRDLLSPFCQVAAAAARGKPAVLPEVYAPREMIYSRDLADALMLLLSAQRPAHKVYNLSVNADWSGVLPQWCDMLQGRMPGFSWRYRSEADIPTIHFPDNRPRTTLSTDRLRGDLHFSPQFTAAPALADYAGWLASHSSYFH